MVTGRVWALRQQIELEKNYPVCRARFRSAFAEEWTVRARRDEKGGRVLSGEGPVRDEYPASSIWTATDKNTVALGYDMFTDRSP